MKTRKSFDGFFMEYKDFNMSRKREYIETCNDIIAKGTFLKNCECHTNIECDKCPFRSGGQWSCIQYTGGPVRLSEAFLKFIKSLAKYNRHGKKLT